MPLLTTHDVWECPECGEEFDNIGKDREKYIRHLEKHLVRFL